MRIGTIADLHFDRHQRLTMEDYLEAVVRLIDQEALNMLIIAGDISNHYSTTFEFIAQLTSEVTIPIYFIPGNHDLWRQPDEQLTTAEILRLYQDHPQCLMGTPVEVDNYVIAGHMGWYDYSFAADRFTYDKLAKGSIMVRPGKIKCIPLLACLIHNFHNVLPRKCGKIWCLMLIVKSF